jgi:putative transcriptional regulator
MIRNRVREICEEMGISMTQLAKGIGTSKASASRIWHDHMEGVTFDVMNKLCAFLNVSVGDLFEYIPDDELTHEDYERLENRKKGIERLRAWRESGKAKKEK